MTIDRRRLLRLGALATAGGVLPPVLAGCRATAAEPIASGDVGVDLWTNDQNYVDYFTGWAKRLSGGDSRYRYTVAGLVMDAEDLATKAMAAYAAKTGIPELLGIEIAQYSRFMKGDIASTVLLDVTDRVAGVADEFFASRWAPYTVHGRRYGVESALPISVWYYREDLFRRYGVPVELDTWDDVLAVGKRLRDRHDVSIMAVGEPGGAGDMTWFGQFLQQLGGHFFDADGNLAIDSPEAVEALTLLVEGAKSGAFTVVRDFYGAPGSAVVKEEKTLAYFMPDWFKSFILSSVAPEQAGKWRMRPPPRFPEGGHAASVWGGTGFTVSKDRAGTEATWELLRQAFLTEEGQVEKFKQIQFLPTMKRAYENPELLAFEDDYLGGQRTFQIFRGLVADIPTQYPSPYWHVMTAELGRTVTEALKGRMRPAAAIKDAAQSITAQMR